MRFNLAISGLLASAILATPALAQSPTTQSREPAPMTATTAAPMSNTGQWRASKLIGVEVYNLQNDKLGEISELLLDQSSKVTGVIVSVGGFLGMGEHDILVSTDKLKFVNEPMRSSAADRTTGAGTAASNPARNANASWYPDHAVLDANKDQLKAMPQFKYSN
jgi:sporulation protein YlmC with PRC-barrel domain